MLHSNDNMKLKSAPSNTMTGVRTNQMGALRAIVACDTNVAFAERNLFLFSSAKSFRILSTFNH